MAKSSQKTVKLLRNPLFIKIITWLAPLVLSFVMKKISEKRQSTPTPSTKHDRKHLKNKAD